jgi:hypothetical protein
VLRSSHLPNEKKREKKRGTRNSLHDEEEQEEEEIYQFKHIPTTQNHGEGRNPLQINRPDTTKTHTITKNWRGKANLPGTGLKEKGAGGYEGKHLFLISTDEGKQKKKEKNRGQITNLDRFMRGREI